MAPRLATGEAFFYRAPFDDETLRLFVEQVAPRVREHVSIVRGQQA